MTVETPDRAKARQRAFIIVGAVVAALALAYLLLLSGGDDEPIVIPDTPRPTGTATPTESPAPEPTDRERPPVASDDTFEGRDPFEPVVILNPPDGNGNGGGGGGGNGDGNGGAIDGNGDTKIIRLVDIFESDGERLAVVEVDGDEFTVAEGETFDDNIRVIDLTRRCGTFVFGDERFTLCIGQEVQK